MPSSHRAKPRRSLGLLITWVLVSSANAAPPLGITVGELALLPTYCPDTQSFGYGDASFNPSPKAGYWVGLMGKSFWHMHHHCYGILKARRATLPGVSVSQRKYLLESAVDEFDYMVKNSPGDFIMLPEVFLRRGDAELQLGRLAAARESYESASRLKPDFAPAYSHWADELFRTGLKKNALAHLEIGLRAAPNSAQLRTHYAKLGGNVEAFLKTLPLPAPTASAPAAATAAIAGPASGVAP